MSAIRVCRDGVWQWQKADDGAVGRVSYSRVGIRGGGPPIVFGHLATGESSKTIADRNRREYNARRDAEAKAASAHDYYLRNKALILDKQRERRRVSK